MYCVCMCLREQDRFIDSKYGRRTANYNKLNSIGFISMFVQLAVLLWIHGAIGLSKNLVRGRFPTKQGL